MALIHCNFFSEVLGISTAMYVVLPQTTRSQYGIHSVAGENLHQTLYLLHGLSDDYTAWVRWSSIERYAGEYGLAVVMPAVNRSFYADMVHGYKYWTFVSEEVPALARYFFRLSDKREDNFVAGLSMGGYGALKMVLSHPDKFAAGASISGVVDLARYVRDNPRDELDNIFGKGADIAGTENDLFHLAKRVAESSGPKPKLFQCCGTEDFLYEDNLKFRDFCRKLSLDLTYEEEPGDHNWAYFDKKIQSILSWLPLKNKK